MERKPGIAVLVALCGFCFVGPWIVFALRGWELGLDCDSTPRAPFQFGIVVAVFALVALVIVGIASITSEPRFQVTLLIVGLLALVMMLSGAGWSLSNLGSSVNCGGTPPSSAALTSQRS